jgi:hypothetical protein
VRSKNLAQNAHCVLTTGCNQLQEGLDIVIEGDAVRVRDDVLLRRVADLYLSKYGEDWRFDVRDGAFFGQGGEALVYEVAPSKILGFAKGAEFSQTRWRVEGT